MKTKIMVFFLIVAFMLGGVVMPYGVIADTEEDYVDEDDVQDPGLPDEDDMFWSFITNPNFLRPDADNCLEIAQTELAADGVSAEEIALQSPQICTQLAEMPTNMQSDMSSANDSVVTNLYDATNWHAVEDLYFEHSQDGVRDGKIAFTQPIDFMTYDFMYFMMTFGDRIEMEEGKIGLEASAVDGMRDYGAVLTMYNLSGYEDPTIIVNGEEDEDGVVSNLVYDEEAGTLTFNASHFSTFEAVESDTLVQTPKITKVKARRYINKKGKERIKVIVKGKHFTKSSEVKLGSKEAYRVKFKHNKRLVAYFKVKDLEKLGKNKFKVRVLNSDSRLKLFKKKLKLDKVKWLED